jgi:DNA relaxase NicK
MLDNVNLLRSDLARGAYSNTPPNSRIEERNTAVIAQQEAIEALEADGTLHPKIDALTLLWEDDTNIDTIAHLSRFLGMEFAVADGYTKNIGTKNWTFCTGEYGTSLAWVESSPGVFTIRFTMAGVACSALGTDEIYLLCCYAKEFLKARCTRIDIQVTDRLNLIDIDQVIDALNNGNYAGFKNYSILHSKRGKYKGTTVYFGSRNGQKFARLYDKFAESRGAESGIRYEVEFKESLADAAFCAYSASDNPLRLATLANLLSGAFRLCEKIDKNLYLCPTLKFWDDFINRITTVHLSIKIVRRPTSIAKKIQWMRRNVVKSLGMLLDAIGWERLNLLLSVGISEARLKFTKFDELIIREYTEYPGAVWDTSDIFYGLV